LPYEYVCEWWKWLKETPFYDEVLRKVDSKPNSTPIPIIAKPSKVEEIHISKIRKNWGNFAANGLLLQVPFSERKKFDAKFHKL
jgi:hypothetical protein